MDPSYSPLFTLGLLADRTPSCAFYFTLHTGRRDAVGLRSFLSLDLAGHAAARRTLPPQPLPLPPLARKLSALSKSTSWTCTTDAGPVRGVPRALVPAVPARRRASKESLRTIPSPKPAPSTTLPDLPTAASDHPRPRPRPRPRSASSAKRRGATAPAPLLSPTPRARHSAPLRSESISSHDRRKSRMDALARLEGRLRKNFMSFSDEDDEDERSTARTSAPTMPPPPPLQIEDQSAFADVEDEVDAVVPRLSRKRQSADPARSARPRKRRSTVESWFPLKSFIDLKDDDLSSWNWRSFIEIGGVA